MSDQTTSANRLFIPDQKPLWQQVHDVLEQMIIRREIKPGERLNEQSLSEQFGVSRGPIREAILALQKDGWVDVQHNYGAFVKVLGPKEAEQLFEIRRILETEAAALAAKKINENQISRLQEIIDQGFEAQGRKDIESSVDLNTQFHRVVCEASGNEILARLMEHVEKQVAWFLSILMSNRGDESWPEHRSLLEAIQAGDSEYAAEIMSKHTLATYNAYMSRLEAGLVDDEFNFLEESAE